MPGFSVNVCPLGNDVKCHHCSEGIQISILDRVQNLIVSDTLDEFIYNIYITKVKNEFIFFPAIFYETTNILRIGSTIYTGRYIICVNTTFFVAEYPLVKVNDATKIDNTSFPNLAINTNGFTGNLGVLVVTFLLNGEFHERPPQNVVRRYILITTFYNSIGKKTSKKYKKSRLLGIF